MKITIKSYGFLLGALAAVALLFTTCENILTQPEIQPETQPDNNYARVRINLVGEEIPLDSQTIARTTFPDLLTDVLYEYYFVTKGEDGKYPAPAGKDLMKPNTDNEFLLPTGDYQVTVKAFDKTSYVAPGNAGNKQGAEGNATFTIASASSVVREVNLKAVADSDDKGKISITIDYPLGATPVVELSKVDTVADNKAGYTPVILTGSSGTYTKDNLDPGSYRLSVVIKLGTKSAGTIEAIHIYPNLKTTYRKSYFYEDLSDPITIGSVALTIDEPRQGVTPIPDKTKVEYTGAYTVTDVKWTGWDESDILLGAATPIIEFKKAYTYSVAIALKANTGYNFAGLTNTPTTKATINLKKATLLKADGSDGDPVSGDTATLYYKFDKTKEVSAIIITSPPTKALGSYAHNDKLDLAGLKVSLQYTTGDSSPAPIPFEDFARWNIKVFKDDGITPVNGKRGDSFQTVLSASDTSLNGKPITLTCNDATVKTGNLTISFKDISSAANKIVITVKHGEYNGSDQTPPLTDISVKDDDLTMTRGTDYEVTPIPDPDEGDRTKADTYPNLVTITGIGNYTGIKKANYIIDPYDISKLSATITIEVEPITYTGSPLTPKVTVKNTNLALAKQKLEAGENKDYTAAYTNNTNVVLPSDLASAVNKPTVTITGKGNYTGTKTANFSIGRGVIDEDNVGDYLIVTGIYDEKVGASTRYTYDGTAKKVTVAIKPTSTGSPITGLGTITILYDEGDNGSNNGITGVGITSLKTVNANTYAVTMTMTSGVNFDPTTTAISLGDMVIDKGRLTMDNFQVISPVVYDGNPKTVATTDIKLVTNSSSNPDSNHIGTVSIVRYTYPGSTIPSTSVPKDVGTYPITVNVESGPNYHATGTAGLIVGQLIIKKKTPSLDDFNINGAGNVGFDGSPKQVIVTPKVTSGTPPTGGNQMTGTGAITVWYTNTNTLTPTTPTTTAPSAQGTYFITFDVAGGDNFEKGVDLGATKDPDPGTKIRLIIGRATPVMDHFDVSPISVTYDGYAKPVTVTPKTGITGMGKVSNIRYTRITPSGSTINPPDAPKDFGKYVIKVDVAQGDSYEATTDLTVGWLDIVQKIPALSDFTITGPTGSTASNANTVWTIKGNGSTGQKVTVKYNSPMTGDGLSDVSGITVKYKSAEATSETTDLPVEEGSYTVKIYVAGGTTSNFTDAAATTGITAGTLVITDPTP